MLFPLVGRDYGCVPPCQTTYANNSSFKKILRDFFLYLPSFYFFSPSYLSSFGPSHASQVSSGQLVVLLILAFLTGVRWTLKVRIMSTFLRYFWAIFTFSVRNSLFRSIAHFKIGSFAHLNLFFVYSGYWSPVSYVLWHTLLFLWCFHPTVVCCFLLFLLSFFLLAA